MRMLCECTREPRGDSGLEGFQLGTIYPYEASPIAKGWVRVYPDDRDPEYYEVCSLATFAKHFVTVQVPR